MFFAGSALPSGRDEAVACGISAAMNELIKSSFGGPPLLLQLSFGLQQIKFESLKLFDLRGDILDLSVKVGYEAVMSDGGLCCRKHGLFLCE